MSAIKSAPWYHSLFSLRWRLAAVYSMLFGLFVILLSIFLYNSTASLLLHNAQVAFPQRARALRTLLIQEVCSSTTTESLASFLQQNTPGDINALYLLDKTGKVIASSNGNFANQLFPYVNPSFFASAPANAMLPFQTHSPGGPTSDGLILSVHAPANCLASAHLPAYMVLLTSYTDEQNTLRTILLLLGISSAIMAVVGTLIISFFTGIMFRPLQQVTRATRALAKGDLQQRVPLPQGQGEISELAMSFNQMANRIEQMFASQQASERRARRFVSDASHELRTPITSLRGFTEVLIRGAKDDPATAQHVLNLMKNEAERMTDLVNDLLTLARLDEGQFPAPENIDLIDIAVTCLQQARKQAAPDCKLGLELTTHERLKIHASGEQIKQLLLVLLDNAVKYGCSSEQKRVLLQMDKKGQHALIQVIDYGPGIASEDLPHIFDRFYRGQNAHGSTSSPVPGTGLGLPIALAIAQAYTGTLTACSDPNQETIFTASFPCVE